MGEDGSIPEDAVARSGWRRRMGGAVSRCAFQNIGGMVGVWVFSLERCVWMWEDRCL